MGRYCCMKDMYLGEDLLCNHNVGVKADRFLVEGTGVRRLDAVGNSAPT